MNKSIEDFLARAALVDSAGIERALEIQAKSGGPIGKILADLGLPEFLPETTGLLPIDFCRERLVVPLGLKGNSLRLAMVNPLDYPTIQEVTDESTRGIPILMLTSEESVDSETMALSLGADDYVHKPVEPRRLAARVKALLARSTARSNRPD